MASFAYVAIFHKRDGENLELSLRAIDLAQQANDLHAEIEARFAALACYRDLGMPDESQIQSTAGLAVAVRLQDRFWLAGALARSLNLAAVHGDWANSRELGACGLTVDETDPRVLSVLVRMEYELGDFERGAAYLNQLIGTGSVPTPQSTLLENVYAVLLISAVYRLTGSVFRIGYAEAAAEAALSSR